MRSLIPLWSLSPEFGRSGLDRLLDELWHGFGAPRAENAADFAPRMDVEESDDEIHIAVELPGLEDKDFEVALEGDVLTVKGQRREEKREERRGFSHVETRRGSFRRALRLPFEPEPDTLKASYRSGVLSIRVPKPEEKSRVRTIPVETA